ncbi:MAG: DUF1289 domain-containing protein [Hellea sp.]|nr:DUF1289 domain-containing protein [Hellea sp.]
MKKEDLDLSNFEPMDSPCQLICSVEKESNRCFGCGRSRDEIARWTLYSKEDRDEILAQLPERMPPLRAILEQRRKKRRVNKRKRSSASD